MRRSEHTFGLKQDAHSPGNMTKSKAFNCFDLYTVWQTSLLNGSAI
ncbi:hypothetical protein [[Pantoea] beijingensis]|nr:MULTISPECIES: hypothetical protein [Erwiniaceae]